MKSKRDGGTVTCTRWRLASSKFKYFKQKTERGWRKLERTLNLSSYNITSPGGDTLTPTYSQHRVAPHPFSRIGKAAGLSSSDGAMVGCGSGQHINLKWAVRLEPASGWLVLVPLL